MAAGSGSGSDASFLAAILDSSEDALVGKDLSGTILSWSRGAERIYGYAAAEAVGRHISIIVPSDRAVELRSLMERVARGERIGPMETDRLTKGGLRLRVMLNLSPIRDESGTVVGMLAIGHDVTVERHVGRRLEAAESQWRAIVESAIDSIVVIDQHGRVESFNPAAERLFGYRASEVLGQNVAMLMPARYAERHDGYLQRYLATGEPRIIGIGREVEGRRKDGTIFPIHLSVGEMQSGAVTKFTGIIHDLTQRTALEARLRDESAMAQLGQLAAVLAHEVRNPLAAVGGAVQMLIEHASLDDANRAVAVEILRRLDGLSALMTDLLRYARPPQPKFTETDLSGLAETFALLFRADPEWRGIQLRIEGGPARVKADPELLKVALQNLIVNAAQAMGGHGAITLRIERANGWVHIDVIDRGPGIPERVRDTLFSPFVTSKARGTGLGLPTVARLARAHSGSVEVLETGPSGTTVRFSLPDGAPDQLA